MKKIITFLLIVFTGISSAQSNNVDTYKLNEDFGQIIQDLSAKYIYLKDKKTDFDCVKNEYANLISEIKTNQERVLFFEYLLDEFYDSHLILNTTTKSSFRLHSPIYVCLKEGKFIIENIWSSQMKSFGQNIIGAEVLNFNSKKFNKVIDDFPTQCVNKNLPEVREWIANKVIAGRYNESRMLTLKLEDDRKISLDIDKIELKKENGLLSVSKKNGIAVVKINNSLGNNNLIKQFDRKLDALLDTEGLILDLRNTVDGGNTYVARAIMSRFIDEELPYQKHVSKEKYGNNPIIAKSWLEYVTPRGKQYTKPVVVLVGRWTGSMGEGLAIGLDGMERAKIVGTEMEKLAGSVVGYSFKNRNFGYRISTDKLYHVNGTIRENFVPEYFVKQNNELNDDVLIKALSLLNNNSNDVFIAEIKDKNSVSVKEDK